MCTYIIKMKIDFRQKKCNIPVAEEELGSSDGKENDSKMNEDDRWNGAPSPDIFDFYWWL